MSRDSRLACHRVVLPRDNHLEHWLCQRMQQLDSAMKVVYMAVDLVWMGRRIYTIPLRLGWRF